MGELLRDTPAPRPPRGGSRRRSLATRRRSISAVGVEDAIAPAARAARLDLGLVAAPRARRDRHRAPRRRVLRKRRATKLLPLATPPSRPMTSMACIVCVDCGRRVTSTDHRSAMIGTRCGAVRSQRLTAHASHLGPVRADFTSTFSGTLSGITAGHFLRDELGQAFELFGGVSNSSSSWICSSIRAAQLFALQPAMDVDHRQLDQVGGRALDHRVDRRALGQVALAARRRARCRGSPARRPRIVLT